MTRETYYIVALTFLGIVVPVIGAVNGYRLASKRQLHGSRWIAFILKRIMIFITIGWGGAYLLNPPASFNIQMPHLHSTAAAASLESNNGVEIAMIDRAFAAAEGQNGTPKAGYLFRILTAQGKNAPGGAYSYMENGRMTKGYALIAWPARYDQAGRKCYMISHNGIIYEADLGPNTTQIVGTITEFDPSSPTWTPTE